MSKETSTLNERNIKPTIGIITALSHEYAAVKVLLESQRPIFVSGRGAGRQYLYGEVPAPNGGRHPIVLALLPDTGNNLASARAALLLEHFPTVNTVIMSGIACGVPYPDKSVEHVRLGDIVVLSREGMVQYDFVKEEIEEGKVNVIPRHPPRPSSASLIETAGLLQAGEMEGERPWVQYINLGLERLSASRPSAETDILASSTKPDEIVPHLLDPRRKSGLPRVFLGPIASANSLLKNPIRRDNLRDNFRVKAVEMEGSGIADSSWHSEISYLVIRGVCDYCDQNKADDWQVYAAIVAAAFVRALLEATPAGTTPDAPNEGHSIRFADANRSVILARDSNQIPSQSQAEEQYTSVDSLTDSSVITSAPWEKPFALIMKGGGIKGLAYVGALKELEKYYGFNWFVGTSAGAIAAVLLAAGYETDELEEILSQTNFKDFLDAALYKIPTNLYFYKGIYPGHKIKAWIESLLTEKLREQIKGFNRVLLTHLPYRATIYASRRGDEYLEFDSHAPESRNIPASYAVRCSMAIPFIFQPPSHQGDDVFDGGMQNNYPVDIFLRRHPETEFVGLYLLPDKDKSLGKPPSLLSQLISIWTESSDIKALKDHIADTVVIDPSPISTLHLHLTKEEKDFLLKEGRSAALRFLYKRKLPNGPTESDVQEAEEQTRQARHEVESSRVRQTRYRWIKIMLGVILIASSGGAGWYGLRHYRQQRKLESSKANTTTSSDSKVNNTNSTPMPSTTPASTATPTPAPTPGLPVSPPNIRQETRTKNINRGPIQSRSNEKIRREKQRAYKDLDYQSPQP